MCGDERSGRVRVSLLCTFISLPLPLPCFPLPVLLSYMSSLFGSEERRRNINLGGTSSATTHTHILNQAKARRSERENSRKRHDSAVRIQAWWRGNRQVRIVRQQLRESFAQDVLGVNGLRCMVMIGKDEEVLGHWSTSLTNGGQGSLLLQYLTLSSLKLPYRSVLPACEWTRTRELAGPHATSSPSPPAIRGRIS